MQRLPVDSSDIVAIGYDPKARILEVEFKEGRIYQYLDVEPDTYRLLMKADSIGQHFQASVMGYYRYKRLGGEAHQQNKGRLAFVTGNAHKLRDLQAVCEPLGIEVEQLDLPVEEIQSHDPEAVALAKARNAYKLAGRPVVINDTFWNILALRGFPGAYMSYVAEWFRPEDFLKLMEGKNDRTVCRTHTVVYFDGKRSKIFSKDFWGKLASEPRGQGASIDQIVITDGQTRTNAEIREAEGRSSIPDVDSAWHEFAKWYNLQRRLGKA